MEKLRGPRIAGSRFALVAVCLRGFIGDRLHLSRGLLHVRLGGFTLPVFDNLTAEEREKERYFVRIIRAVVSGVLGNLFQEKQSILYIYQMFIMTSEMEHYGS